MPVKLDVQGMNRFTRGHGFWRGASCAEDTSYRATWNDRRSVCWTGHTSEVVKPPSSDKQQSASDNQPGDIAHALHHFVERGRAPIDPSPSRAG